MNYMAALCLAALAVLPARAETPVYVPSMGAAPAAPLPTTVTEAPRVYVPPTGPTGSGLRFPDRIEAPPPTRYRNRNATVPTPRRPHVGRIPVPDQMRRGETSQDRIKRCEHYGAAYGVPKSQRGAYVNRCAFGD